MSIKENLEMVRENIHLAARRSGRNSDEIKLIAVSKTYPAEDILKAYECGVREIGENRVQELCEKRPVLPEAMRIHLIGHLQTNKVKQAVKNACLIHSVDSVKLAEEISKASVKEGLVTPILLQVNVAEDEAKFGLDAEELEGVINKVSCLPGIILKGLMTVPAIETDPERTRGYFRKLRGLFEEYKDEYNLTELSMGMSGDYEIAVEEGATMVRVGSKIFGARNYSV